MSVHQSRYKYIAFHNGELITDHILEYIIDAALRGLMTPSGSKLLLIPDTRQGPADISGLRHVGKFRKADCLTVKQLICKIRRSKTLPKTAKNRSKNTKKNSALKTAKTRSGSQVSDCYFLQKECGSGGLGQVEALEVQR